MIAVRGVLPALALLLLPVPAMAQQAATPPAPGAAQQAAIPAAPGASIPEALRGAWFAGTTCADTDPMLFLTARGALRLPGDGTAILRRFATLGIAPGGWTLGTAGGAQAPRLALRSPGPDRLDTVEPAVKTRDDRLPGADAVQVQWRRCPTIPAGLAARHAEAIDAMMALEQIEQACAAGTTVADCLASLVARLDVSADGALSVAELARFGRGAAALAALLGSNNASAASADAVLAAARRLVDTLDYDGDGKLSKAELMQDRGGPGASLAGGGPLSALPALPGLDALRGPPAGTR